MRYSVGSILKRKMGYVSRNILLCKVTEVRSDHYAVKILKLVKQINREDFFLSKTDAHEAYELADHGFNKDLESILKG